MFRISSKADGPLTDGRAVKAVREYGDAAEKTVAETGEQMLRANLGQVLRHPTGYYVSRVRTEPVGDLHQVNDSGVIYGPWLEGVGSRNRSTRFKGYRHWLRTTRQLQRNATKLAERVLPRYLRRMQ